MAERVYCIVKKDGDYYIPVKAKLNPYNRRRAYLACLPNFFGGKMEDGENDEQNDEQALIREVREESQENINIEGLGAEGLQLLYQCQIEEDHYRFYLVTMTEGVVNINGDVFLLDDGENLPNEQREMRCILKIPVNRLAGVTNDRFLGISKEWVSPKERETGKILVNFDPRYPNDENNRALKQWKTDVGTKDAFRVLFGLH